MKNEQESWSAEKKKLETQSVEQEKQYKDSLQRLEEKIVTLVSDMLWVYFNHCLVLLNLISWGDYIASMIMYIM